MNDETEARRDAVAGQVERPVRPLVDAYEDFCGVERGRFDGCTLAEMEDGAAFAGFGDYAALGAALLDALEQHATFNRWAVHQVQEHEAIVPGEPEAPNVF